MGTRIWTRCAGLVVALVVGLALAPVPASADTLYLRILWIRCQDQSEPFDRRQPEQLALAGLLGLGTFRADAIDHRVHALA